MKTEKWIAENCASLSGRVIAVSGSTGGLGRELCRHLAGLGAELILLDRNTERSMRLGEELKADFPTLTVSYVRVDMTDFSSVRNAVARLEESAVDTLVLNAGAYHIPRFKTDLGIDNVFQINCAAPYYIAKRLLPTLRARGGRVVAVGSIAHRYSRVDPSDEDFTTRRKPSLVYGNAKRRMMYSMMSLGEGVSIVHPGITFTNITSHYPKLIFALIKHPMKVIFMKPRRAALSILAGIYRDTAHSEWIGPRLFDVWGLPRVSRLRGCDESEQDHIVSRAEALYRKMETHEFSDNELSL